MANILKQFIVFLLGFFIGAIIAVIYHDLSNSPRRTKGSKTIPLISDNILYEFSFRKLGFKRRLLNPDDVSFESDNHYFTESDFLYKNISVICVVFVHTGSNADAYHVANTWGKKCNRLIFFGEKSNHHLNVKRVKYIQSWQYLCESIKYVWSNYKNELQWTLFSPDKVFIIPENLRYFLAPKDYMKPYYIGHKVMFWNQIYNSRIAGYILSYKAIEKLMDKFALSCSSSSKYSNNEDYYLGLHLEEVGVKATDAIDDRGRERFHLFTPAQLVAPGSYNVLQKYSKLSLSSIIQGFNCCSPSSISFQGSSKDSAYLINYLLYNVKLFNTGNKGNKKSASYTSMDEVWKKFLADELGNVNPDKISNEDYYKLWTLKVESPKEFNEKLKKVFQASV